MDLKSCRQSFISKRPLLCCASIFFFTAFALFGSSSTRSLCLDIRSPPGRKPNCYSQKLENTVERREDRQPISISNSKTGLLLSRKRRYLVGLGSSPPRCMSKCGKCTPCKPVHVPVPPGTPVTTEYYPEAWRCKCGNKLYMP